MWFPTVDVVSSLANDEVENNINRIDNEVNNETDGSKSAVNVQEDEIIFRYWNKWAELAKILSHTRKNNIPYIFDSIIRDQAADGDVIHINNASETTLRGWRKNTALKIITHGWLSSAESRSVEGIQEGTR